MTGIKTATDDRWKSVTIKKKEKGEEKLNYRENLVEINTECTKWKKIIQLENVKLPGLKSGLKCHACATALCFQQFCLA